MEKEQNRIDIPYMDERRSDKLAQLFRALGDATRVKILFLISDSEMCVSEVAALLHMTEAAVSHQFRVLRLNGLVKRKRYGKMIYYKLSDFHVNAIMAQGLNTFVKRKRAHKGENV